MTAWIAAAMAGSLHAANLVLTTIAPLKALADAGDVEAQSLLAGVLLDYVDDSALALAFEYATAAARTGHPAGQRTLGLMYRTGRGAQASALRAEELFRAASSAGDPYAAFNLAGMHITDDIGARDHTEYLRLLRQAANGGVAQAAVVLADQLSAADQDAEALTWYLHAAQRGHAKAMFAAGCRYRDGLGTHPDSIQAVRWFLAMLARGDGDGVHEAIELAKQGMTDKQIRTAGELADRPAETEALIRTLARARERDR